jgi:hypothetical protein
VAAVASQIDLYEPTLKYWVRINYFGWFSIISTQLQRQV